jgi:hypothetical protein
LSPAAADAIRSRQDHYGGCAVANSWLVRHQDKSYGPFSLEQLQSLVASGRVIPDSPVSLDGQIWTSAGKVKGLVFANLAPTPGRPIPLSPVQAAAPIPLAVQPGLTGARADVPLASAATPAPAAADSGPSEPEMEFLASTPSRSAKAPLRLAKKNNDSGLVVVLGAAAVFLGLAMAGAYYVFVSPSKETALGPRDSGGDRSSREPSGETRESAAVEKPAAAKKETTTAAEEGVAKSGVQITYADDNSERAGKSRASSGQAAPEMKPVVTDLASVDAALSAESAAANQAAMAANAAAVPRGRAWTSYQGATNESEDAVDKALKWLAEHQMQNGGWCYNHNLGPCHGQCSDPGTMPEALNGATGMACLCFISHGNTHRGGRYQAQVIAGLKFLISRMGHDGSMYEKGGRMYSHALATLALCEDLRIRKDKDFAKMTSQGLGVLPGPPAEQAGGGEADEKPIPGFKPHSGPISFRDKQAMKEQNREGQAMEGIISAAALRAVEFILHAQDTSNGGWRYEPATPDSDISVTGWQVMALFSAGKAQVYVRPTWHDMLNKFLDKIQTDNYGSQYGYHLTDDKSPTPTRSAIGLLCRLYTNWTGAEQGFVQGTQSLGRTGINQQDMYQDYYVTLLLHHVGGQLWDTWNDQMRPYLIRTQATAGHETGSWSFHGGSGSTPGGRHYNTCMATLILETYYRSKPLLAPTSEGRGAIPQ